MEKTIGNAQLDLTGLVIENRQWATQSEWFIDSVNGNDENDGTTQQSAIKTWAELEAARGSGNVIKSYQTELPIVSKVGVLKVIENIDLKAVGQTDLFTGINGKSLDILDIRLIVTEIDGLLVAPTIKIGKSPNFDEWASAISLNGLNSVGKSISLAELNPAAIRSCFSSGETIKLDVSIGATASTLKVKAVIIGYQV